MDHKQPAKRLLVIHPAPHSCDAGRKAAGVAANGESR